MTGSFAPSNNLSTNRWSFAPTRASPSRLRNNNLFMGPGTRGQRVSALQERLKNLGFAPGPIDGDFGPLTERAVRDFQRSRDLTVDGLVGRQTLSKLVGSPSLPRQSGDSFERRLPSRSTGLPNARDAGASPFILASANRETPPGSATSRLHDWYSKPENYARVRNSIAGTRNMCANYITTALEKSGVLNIPRSRRYVGFDDTTANSVRMWAPSLARYLENEEGWQRVNDVRRMQAGDVVFTDGREGTYNHVMMLDSWVDRANGIARVTDNQGFATERDLFGGGRSPVSYALRKFEPGGQIV